MINNLKRAVVAAVALAVTTACDSGHQTGGVLDLGQGEHDICVPAPSKVKDSTLFGDTVVVNRSDSAITITAVDLVEPHGMRLREAALVAVEPGMDLIGIRHLSDTKPLPASWDERVSAEGAILRPGEEWNLVPIVKSGLRDTASARATRLYYETADGKKYWQDTITAMLVTTGSCENALAGWNR